MESATRAYESATIDAQTQDALGATERRSITQPHGPSGQATRATERPLRKHEARINGEHTSPTVSVVIPTLNEAENLPHVMGELPAWIDEVIVVDGYSTDDTLEVAERLRPDVVIVHQNRRGKGDALRLRL